MISLTKWLNFETFSRRNIVTIKYIGLDKFLARKEKFLQENKNGDMKRKNLQQNFNKHGASFMSSDDIRTMIFYAENEKHLSNIGGIFVAISQYKYFR